MVKNQTSKRTSRKRYLLPLLAILIVAGPLAPFIPPSLVDGVMMALTVYTEEE